MIELRRLGYLVVLAKRLSYSRAAIELGLSQSALTRAIQSLEKEIGIRLFDRDQSGVRLTDQGRWVVAKAEILLTNATDFANQLTFAAKGVEGRIRFGMTDTAAHLLLPQTLPARLLDAPRFAHDILVRHVEPLYLMLAQGEIEFLICSEQSSIWSIPDVMPVDIEPLGKFPIELVVRNGHPLLGPGTEEMRFPILVASVENSAGHLPPLVRDRMGTSLQVVEDIGILASLVRATDAVWITSSATVSDGIAQGTLRCLPLPDDLQPRSFELFVYSLARRSRSPAARDILQAYREYISRIGNAGTAVISA